MFGDHASGGYGAFASSLPVGLGAQLLAFILTYTSRVALIEQAPSHRVADGKISIANKAFECMGGYTQAEWHGQNSPMRDRQASVKRDPDLFPRILDNGLSTAFKFTLVGGVHALPRQTAHHITLAVAMIPAHGELACEPFGQESKESTQTYEGLDIGYAAVKGFGGLVQGRILGVRTKSRGAMVIVRSLRYYPS